MEQSKTNTPRGAAKLNRLIDFNSYPLNLVLRILLKDRTTGENIIWATDNYSHLGNTYHSAATMRLKDLVKLDKSVIQPRVYKTLELQKQRTKVNAEVFTPSWICCLMNNHLDDVWFNRKDVFNKMDGQKWRASNRKIEFPTSGSKTWMGYVDSRRLEITCGEAPYLVSRYDTTTGKVLDLTHRIGILDRKLRVINENVNDEAEWMKWVLRAYQSTYGYEYQGDNLLIARINLLMTFCDYMQARWDRNPTEDELKAVAFVISWNIWQMNGLTYKTSYDADADRKRLQEIIDDCDDMLHFYDKHLNPPEKDDGTYTPDEIQMIESMLENKKNELTMDELIEIVKQEDLRELATMYADYHGIRIIDGDVPDYSAELAKLRQEMVVDRNEVQLLRDETYAEKCMIIDAPDCLIKNWRMRRTEYFRDIAQKSKGKGIMKFDFAIGNPPYQESQEKSENQTQGNSSYIYQHFQRSADLIAGVTCLIYPFGGWFDAPERLGGLGNLILKDGHTVSISAFEGTNDKRAWYRTDKLPEPIFGNNANLSAGVAIVIRDLKNQHEEFDFSNRIYSDSTVRVSVSETDSITPNPEFMIINRKLGDDKLYLHTKNGVFGIESDFAEKNPDKVSFNKEDWEHPIHLLTNDKSGSSGRATMFWTDKENIKKGIELIALYKVITTSAYPKQKFSSGKPTLENVKERARQIVELMPEESAFGRSRMLLFASLNKQDCENFIKYTQTNFFAGLMLQEPNRRTTFGFIIPYQDFTEKSDIDWSLSIEEIDKQLYKKYGLSQDEIDFIESKVKEME